ncbi:TetR/AcrR family transcriptional regulator [Thermomonospora cellulosilytica]|uniref:AcrR family transcriptional regulator n=1 Tax=Thermomonospora cellulosilytica TaxID=1411118 RepID=A0A7W3N3P2_9ACTN|nr:TetR/AcrR family transcriptional regulator [Thermomonospora cellulosilytica]MBA9006934.1 AcrR family transcriptional regulator [Thermomonospora cellulosilytica]
MPKVSEEHLQRRRNQILDAARLCFVRKGFHETSMQDIFAASGLSAGAVYRYFKSKNEIVEAICTDTVERIADPLARIVEQDPLPGIDEVAGRMAEELVGIQSAGDGEADPLRVAPQAWALALHDPQVSPVVRRVMAHIRGVWIQYAERMRDAGRLPADADTEAVGKALFGIMPGFVLQRLILGDVDPDTLRRGLRDLSGSLP